MKPRIALNAATFGLALLVVGSQCYCQGTSLLKSTFEENEGGWITFGGNSKISISHDADNIKEGKGALQYSYNIAKGEMGALALPTSVGDLTKMKSLKFWLKTDHTTPIVVFLQEKDGGRYSAAFTVEQNKWQRVELAASDFNLNTGPGDPKDPNDKLDVDKIESMGLGDFAQFFIQGDANVTALLNIKSGPHILYLDEVLVTDEALPSYSSTLNGELRLDNMSRPQISWIGIGQVKLSQTLGKPLDGKSLQADYHMSQGKVMGLLKSISKGALTGSKQLTFSIASAKPTKLLVQVEEKSGGKYNAMVDLEGSSTAKEVKLVFADFNQADDSKDDNSKLDMDQVIQILFIDFTGIVGEVNQDNTIWINNVRTGAIK
jgi:hypothetical protein